MRNLYESKRFRTNIHETMYFFLINQFFPGNKILLCRILLFRFDWCLTLDWRKIDFQLLNSSIYLLSLFFLFEFFKWTRTRITRFEKLKISTESKKKGVALKNFKRSIHFRDIKHSQSMTIFIRSSPSPPPEFMNSQEAHKSRQSLRMIKTQL